MIILKLIVGLVLLIVGAESLVKGAATIARAAGISSLVIGLTVVSMGTSTPELAVSIISTASGNSNLALGNVIGSNIFNVLFILGVSALITPLVAVQQLIRIDVPVMIAASLLVLLFGIDGRIAGWEGLILVLLGVLYTVFIVRDSRKEKSTEVLKEYHAEFSGKKPGHKASLTASVLFVLAGIAMLVIGSRWLVDGAVFVAGALGVSDLVIGLTIIAVGTSLPEVATSIIASIRGERDIAVGNAVGSNIFNILFILGFAAIAGHGGVAISRNVLSFDIPVMIAVALTCLPIFFTGRKLDRWEGAVFVVYYLAYIIYSILSSQKAEALNLFRVGMIGFVIPLTLLTLGIVTVRELRKLKK